MRKTGKTAVFLAAAAVVAGVAAPAAKTRRAVASTPIKNSRRTT
jgi:hypothetical protein